MHSQRLLEQTIENAKQHSDFEGVADGEIKSRVRAMLEQQQNFHKNDLVSVFCLSNSPVARVMWSYYANEHKGLADEKYFVYSVQVSTFRR